MMHLCSTLWKDCGCHVHLHSRRTKERRERPPGELVIKGPNALAVAKWVLAVSKVALEKFPATAWKFKYPSWISVEAPGSVEQGRT